MNYVFMCEFEELRSPKRTARDQVLLCLLCKGSGLPGAASTQPVLCCRVGACMATPS